MGKDLKAVPEIVKCTSVMSVRSVHTGNGVCIGFTKETPDLLPEGDVIHFCMVSKEHFERSKGDRCILFRRISCTVLEAERIGMKFIVAADLQLHALKKKEEVRVAKVSS